MVQDRSGPPVRCRVSLRVGPLSTAQRLSDFAHTYAQPAGSFSSAALASAGRRAARGATEVDRAIRREPWRVRPNFGTSSCGELEGATKISKIGLYLTISVENGWKRMKTVDNR